MKPRAISKDQVREMDKLGRIFDGPVLQFLPLVDICVQRTAGLEYEFLDLETYHARRISDPLQANQDYWREILYRAHWAAIASLIRSRRWFDGTMNACDAENYLAFCGCLRSLVEATGDSFPTMITVAKTLALQQDTIRRRLTSAKPERVESKELEDALIHFLFARKLSSTERKAFPDSHVAKHASEYVATFKKVDQTAGIADLYSFLCQVVHPAAHSVHSFTAQGAEGQKYVVRLDPASDKGLIKSFVAANSELLGRLAYLALEPPLWVLHVLHKFQIGPQIKELRKFPSYLPSLKERLVKALTRKISSYDEIPGG
jgi:hypothetical protein